MLLWLCRCLVAGLIVLELFLDLSAFFALRRPFISAFVNIGYAINWDLMKG